MSWGNQWEINGPIWYLSSMNTAWFLHGTRRLISRNPTGSGSHPSTLSAQGKVLILGGKRPPIISQFVFPLSEKVMLSMSTCWRAATSFNPKLHGAASVFICVGYNRQCSQGLGLCKMHGLRYALAPLPPIFIVGIILVLVMPLIIDEVLSTLRLTSLKQTPVNISQHHNCPLRNSDTVDMENPCLESHFLG